MSFHQLIRHQDIPADLEVVWDFMSRPENLGRITPPHMNFEIITAEVPEAMYPGMMIGYKVSPLPGLRLKWLTEITHIRDRAYFVDEQRVGPYKVWHHEHILTAIPGGVRMTDIITYKLPCGPLGSLANALFVRRQIESIFDFRVGAVEAIFGRFKS